MPIIPSDHTDTQSTHATPSTCVAALDWEDVMASRFPARAVAPVSSHPQAITWQQAAAGETTPMMQAARAAVTYSRLPDDVLDGRFPPPRGQTDAPQPAAPAAGASSTRWAVQEAPASCCLKFHLGGIEVLYTMRDIDDDTLYARIRRILPRLIEKVSDGAPPIPAPQEPRTPQADAPPFCDVHQVSLEQRTNAKGKWWSHWVTSERRWCKGA